MKIFEVTYEHDENDDTVRSMVNEHCQHYLGEVGGFDNALFNFPLYRGLSNPWPNYNDVIICPVNQNRPPQATSNEDHDIADEWFQQHSTKGIKYRSQSIFCTGSKITAETYSRGQVAIVIPVGDYNYCWGRYIFDMFSDLEDLREHTPTLDILNLLTSGGYQENSNLLAAIKSHHEIMLNCKEVLLIKTQWKDRNSNL